MATKFFPLVFFSIFPVFLSLSPILAADKDDGALFYEGHDWMERKNPAKAIPLFEEVLAKFPKSNVRDLAYFWLGRAYLETNQADKHKETMLRMRKEFPKSPLTQKIEALIDSKEAPAPKSDRQPKPIKKAPQPDIPIPPKAPFPPIVSVPIPARIQPIDKTLLDQPSLAEGFFLAIPQIAEFQVEPSLIEKRGSPGEEVAFVVMITNKGNAEDAFTLESTFPGEFVPAFFPDEGGKSSEEVRTTPSLQPNQSFRVKLRVRYPAGIGGRRTFEVKVASRFDRSRFQSVTVVAAGPILQGEHLVNKGNVRPGEEVRYTFLLKNLAADVIGGKVNYVYHPALVFRTASPQAERVDPGNYSISWKLPRIEAKSTQKIEIAFQVGERADASLQILNRGFFSPTDASWQELTQLSPAVTVSQISSVRVDGPKDVLNVTSKNAFFLPFTLTNLGNGGDVFMLKSGGYPLTFYYDRNRDRSYQPGEPVVTETPLLGPGEDFPILTGLKVPAGHDGEKFDVGMEAQSKRDNKVTVSASRTLLLSRPMLVVNTEMQPRDNLPSGTFAYQVTVTNTGSGLAKNVVMTEHLPAELVFVRGNPDPVEGGGKKWVWKLPELGPRQKTTFAIRFQIQSGLRAGTMVQKQTEVYYQDFNGNVYP